MNARRTFRLLSSFALVQQAFRSLAEPCAWGSDAFSRLCFVASRQLMVVWVLLDNFRCLQEIGWILPGKERVRTTRRINFGAFTVASALSLAYWVRRLSRGESERGLAVRNIVKESLNTVTFAHVSELAPPNEIMCGVAGACASAIDVYGVWRTAGRPQVPSTG